MWARRGPLLDSLPSCAQVSMQMAAPRLEIAIWRVFASAGCAAGLRSSCSPAQAKWGLLVQRQLRSGTRMPAIRPGPRALSSLHAFYTEGAYDCLQKTVTDRI